MLVLAQEEAHLLGHGFIGTEHLLLGLVKENEGPASEALSGVGATLAVVRERVGEIVGRSTEVVQGSPPFTPRSKKVLELALREALQLGHNYIGTEHLLLGLLREGEGVAVAVLVGLGVDLAELSDRVLQLHATAGAEEAVGLGEGQLRPSVTGALRRFRRAPVTGPTCPGCRADLAGTLAYRTLDVPADQVESAGPRRAAVWWCRECGRTLGVSPEPAPPG